ncbi:MAG: histidinol-phosphate transaminase, partial [Oscillospiraceae bacterium]|nr:histidinol-phosphate transaminase [Oscillospiraceae bacterium]
MKEFWSARIRDAVPYVPGEQPRQGKWIKLNTNENPYPPSPRALEAIAQAANEQLRLYPDPECTRLRAAAAQCWGVKPEQVFCGNGSDEILAFCFQAFFDPDRPVVFPAVSYSFYPVYADYFGLTCRQIPMNEDFSVPLERLWGDNGGVVLPNPNAPTGRAVGLEEIKSLLEHNPQAVVLIDEAYVDFGASSAVPLIEDYPNLLVVQTLSKSRSLAGLRVGFALGQENLIAALRCVRDSINSYTVDRVAQTAAAAALEDRDYFEQTRRRIMDTREGAAQALKQMGFEVCPSKSNFLFIRHPDRQGKALFDELRQRGILVRRWDREEIRDWLRVTVGTQEQMQTLLAQFR